MLELAVSLVKRVFVTVRGKCVLYDSRISWAKVSITFQNQFVSECVISVEKQQTTNFLLHSVIF